jgi:hypothetical protein
MAASGKRGGPLGIDHGSLRRDAGCGDRRRSVNFRVRPAPIGNDQSVGGNSAAVSLSRTDASAEVLELGIAAELHDREAKF